MKLEKCFEGEVKKINGDGSREKKFAILKAARAAARELSVVNVRTVYPECIKKYGRVIVEICTAATIISVRDRLSYDTVQWAEEVLKLWTTRPADISSVVIRDGLHPTRIEEYAAELIRLTID